MTSGYKEEQQKAALDDIKQRVYNYREVISTPANDRTPWDYSKILWKCKELYTKLHIIKPKFKATKITSTTIKDTEKDCVVKLQKLINHKFLDIPRNFAQWKQEFSDMYFLVTQMLK